MIRLSQTPTNDQAQAIITAGPGACVQHPRAGNRRGRGKVERQLGALGVPRSIVATLGWSTGSTEPEAPDQAAAAAELE
jgi:hypothetical protein